MFSFKLIEDGCVIMIYNFFFLMMTVHSIISLTIWRSQSICGMKICALCSVSDSDFSGLNMNWYKTIRGTCRIKGGWYQFEPYFSREKVIKGAHSDVTAIIKQIKKENSLTMFDVKKRKRNVKQFCFLLENHNKNQFFIKYFMNGNFSY